MQKDTALTPESPTAPAAAGKGAGKPERALQRSFAKRVGIFLYEFFTAYQHGNKRSVLVA